MLKVLNKTAIAFCLLMAAATATEHLVQVDRATDEIEDEKTVDSGRFLVVLTLNIFITMCCEMGAKNTQ